MCTAAVLHTEVVGWLIHVTLRLSLLLRLYTDFKGQSSKFGDVANGLLCWKSWFTCMQHLSHHARSLPLLLLRRKAESGSFPYDLKIHQQQPKCNLHWSSLWSERATSDLWKKASIGQMYKLERSFCSIIMAKQNIISRREEQKAL